MIFKFFALNVNFKLSVFLCERQFNVAQVILIFEMYAAVILICYLETDLVNKVGGCFGKDLLLVLFGFKRQNDHSFTPDMMIEIPLLKTIGRGLVLQAGKVMETGGQSIYSRVFRLRAEGEMLGALCCRPMSDCWPDLLGRVSERWRCR